MSGRGAKIGVLDSGIGGLSVLREIHRRLPGYPTVYVADTAHLPYGPRDLREIHAYVDGIARFLRTQGAAVVVLACHAASAASLYTLREASPGFPFVGIEPAIKPAIERTRTGVVGVLTTQATADGPLYRRVLARFGGKTRVITRVAADLVTLAENGQVETAAGQTAVAAHICPLVEQGVDQIVLACTHFSFLAREIQAAAGPSVTLVDPGPAVARQVARVWPAGMAAARESHRYYATGSPDSLEAAARRWLGVEIKARALRWSDAYEPEAVGGGALTLAERA